MSLLARKISRAKWEAGEDLGQDEIPADAVSADLRTTGNTLSFWTCPSDGESDLRKAVLALAAAAERVDRMDLAWIEEPVVRHHEILAAFTRGRTPVESLQEHHVDLVRLDVKRLGKVAELLADAIRRGNHRRMTRKQVLSIVTEAVRDDLVPLKDLQCGVREEVQKALNDSG